MVVLNIENSLIRSKPQVECRTGGGPSLHPGYLGWVKGFRANSGPVEVSLLAVAGKRGHVWTSKRSWIRKRHAWPRPLRILP